MNNPPSEMLPWLLVGVNFLIAMLLLIAGVLIRNLNEDVKENSKKIALLEGAFMAAVGGIKDQVHGVEKKLLEHFTPISEFRKVSEEVGEHATTLARLKTRDELRWMQDGSRSKQG